MAADMFLMLDGIKGESSDDKHKGEIDIESFSWGLAQQGSGQRGTGSGTGKVDVHDINITKKVDKSSPTLQLACANGKHIAKGKITLRKAGENPLDYLTFDLFDFDFGACQRLLRLQGVAGVLRIAQHVAFDPVGQEALHV